MSLPYNGKLIPRAKELRKDMTKQEKHLWYDFLSNYQIRFQRQKTISQYIVDFYCAKVKLAIELDGSQHYTENGLEYDNGRTKVLNAFGVEVIRFFNNDIDNNFSGVCDIINEVITSRLNQI
jgi:very-short-patch-repair endonuclease